MHYGVILNDHGSIGKLGDLSAPPYKGAPKAPILYLKPANTLASAGVSVMPPAGADAVEVGATVGLVIGRPAARLKAEDALSFVREIVLAADLSLPHESYYRPAIREKCFDQSLVLGPRAPVEALADLIVTTEVEGVEVDEFALADLIRDPAQLLADVTEFMTLAEGDVLLVGVRYRAPEAGPGASVTVRAKNIGSLQFSIQGVA